MSAFDIQVDDSDLTELEHVAGVTQKQLQRAFAGANNDTAKQLRTRISSRIRGEVVIKKRDVDKLLPIARATPSKPESSVTMEESRRPSLKAFGARQTRRGVTYRIKRGGKRKRIASAFGPNIDRLGGNVFVRVGKSRLPIAQRRGPSPWGVFTENNWTEPTEKEAAELQEKNIERRANLLWLRLTGEVA